MDNSITDKNNKSEENKSSLPASNLSNQVVSANGMINSVSSLTSASTSSSSSSSSSAFVVASSSSTTNNTSSQPSTTMLSIKVHIIDLNITKTLQFNPTTLVFDALKIIREKVPETNTETGKLLLVFLSSSSPLS